MSTPKLGDALASSQVLIDRPALEHAIERMAGEIRAAYGDGEVPLDLLDDAVRRVLRMKFRLGLFDDPYPFLFRFLELP